MTMTATSTNAQPETHAETPDRPAMRWGYARVSLSDGRQDEEPQARALELAGVSRVFRDRVHSDVPPADRDGWTQLLQVAKPGDEIVVWKVDRVSRGGIRETFDVADDLHRRGITLVLLTEGIRVDGTPLGEIVLAVLAWAANQERSAIRLRTREALAQRRAAGVRLGRPPALTIDQRDHVRKLATEPGATLAGIARVMGCSPQTVRRVIEANRR